MDIAGKRIALHGRLLGRRPADVFAVAHRLGATLERGVTRATDLLVVGRGSLNLVPSGGLARTLKRAEAMAIPIIGEKRFAGLLDGRAEKSPTYPVDRIGADADLLRLLNAFDIAHVAEGCCRFSDVQAIRTAITLAGEGHDAVSLLGILLRAEQVAPTGRHRLVTEDGEPRLVWDDGVTTLDGQGLLPLDALPDIDEIFEEALLAEAEGDFDAAARLYEACTRADRKDPIAPFNLANVLTELGRHTEALNRYGQAIARHPHFAEAYYNRAALHERLDQIGSAIADLNAALSADPDYGHAMFNLAQLELRRGNREFAIDLLDRFLSVETDPEACLTARQLRLQARNGNAASGPA